MDSDIGMSNNNDDGDGNGKGRKKNSMKSKSTKSATYGQELSRFSTVNNNDADVIVNNEDNEENDCNSYCDGIEIVFSNNE